MPERPYVLPLALKKLHRAFVLLCRRARAERAEVLAFARFKVFFARVKSIFARFKLPYHA